MQSRRATGGSVPEAEGFTRVARPPERRASGGVSTPPSVAPGNLPVRRADPCVVQGFVDEDFRGSAEHVGSADDDEIAVMIREHHVLTALPEDSVTQSCKEVHDIAKLDAIDQGCNIPKAGKRSGTKQRRVPGPRHPRSSRN